MLRLIKQPFHGNWSNEVNHQGNVGYAHTIVLFSHPAAR